MNRIKKIKGLTKDIIKHVRRIPNTYISLCNQNAKLRKFRNIHKGKDFVLLGAGQSLDEIPHDFLEKFIVIGTNNTINYFKPNYWLVVDTQFSWLETGRKICFDNDIFAFINWIWAEDKQKKSYPNEINLHPNNISVEQSPDNSELRNTLINLYENPTYIEKKGFSAVNSVITEAAIPLALYMGCRDIYLAGVDFYTPKQEENFLMKPSEHDQKIKNKYTKMFQKKDGSKKDMWAYKRWGIEMISETKLKNRVFNLGEKSSVKKIPKIHYSRVKIQS